MDDEILISIKKSLVLFLSKNTWNILFSFLISKLYASHCAMGYKNEHETIVAITTLAIAVSQGRRSKISHFSSVAPLCPTFCDPMDCRLPCPSPAIGVHSNPCPSHRWCHPTISSSVIPISSCSQSFPASGSFPMSQIFASGGQSVGVSASTSVLPMNIQVISFRIDWFDLIAVQGTLKSLLQHHSSKASILQCSTFFVVQLSHPCMTSGNTIIWLDGPLLAK